MTKLNNGFFSSPTGGKIGNYVIYTRLGTTCARSKPSKFKDKKSKAQQAQRMRFEQALLFLRPFKNLLRIGFAGEALHRTAFNAAQSYQLKHAMSGEYPNIYVDYSKSMLTKGNLMLPEQISLSRQGDRFLIQWEPSAEDKNRKDTLIVAGFCEGIADYQLTGVCKFVKQYEWTTFLAQKENVHLWIAFRSCKEDDVSDSYYCQL